MIKNGSASIIFDLIRFLAALAVLLGHGVSRFFGPYDPIHNNGFGEKVFRVVFSGYGSHGVTIFFIMSGFFIGSSILKQLSQQRFSWKNYFSRRLIRLWIVLLPALCITVLVDYIGVKLFPNDAIYSGGTVIGAISGMNASVTQFVGNALFLQTIWVPTLGTNGALWSLANEFWYYLLFPILVFALTSDNVIKKLAYALLAMVVSICVGLDILIAFPVWLLGVVVYLAPRGDILRFKGAFFLVLALLLGTMLFIRISPALEPKIIERLLISVPFTLFAMVLLSKDRQLTTSSFSRFSQKSAAFSYTLYLIHTPILCFLRAFAIDGEGFWEVTVENILFFSCFILFIIGVAYVLGRYTEGYTHKVYRMLKV